MATMLDLYNSKKDLPDVNGRILDLPKVDANASIDQTPYSVGANKAGAKGPDEKGISAVENDPNSPYQGNRYGQGVGKVIGGGSVYLPNGYSDAKLYSSTNPQ